MIELLPFFIVIFAGVFFSAIFNRLHLPWVIALILGGILIGPQVLHFFEPNETVKLLSQIGLVFLMFMAGLETRLSGMSASFSKVSGIAAINGVVPFLVGIGIGYAFGLDILSMLLLGVIFISSSVAVVIPSLESNGILHTKLGDAIISSTVLQDIASLIILSVILQSVAPITFLPLPVFYIFLFVVLLFLRWSVPRVRRLMSKYKVSEKDLFQQEIRTIFVILIGVVILFEILGLHPIIGGFFAGLILSDSITSEVVKEKIRTVSYGLFIPIFFIVVGAETDISVFSDLKGTALIAAVIVVGSMVSKYWSGYFAGKYYGFSKKESTLIGVTSIPQLSTTIAVAITGFELGLLSADIVTAMVTLSIITTFVSPFILSRVAQHNDLEKVHVAEGMYSTLGTEST